MRKYLVPVLLILSSLACSLPVAAPSAQAISTIDIPTFTPTAQVPEKPTDLPAPPVSSTPEAPAPTASSTPEIPAPAPVLARFDPRSVADCDIFVDSDFANTIGAIPDTKLSLSEAGKQSCQYNFDSSTLVVLIVTSIPGREAFENVRKFDPLSGVMPTPYPIGDMAVIKNFDDGSTLEAVLNGWYVALHGNGIAEENLVLLAELLLAHLTPYTP